MNTLAQMYTQQPQFFEGKSIGPIVNWAGNMLDIKVSTQVREYFHIVPSETLYRYIEECLTEKIENSGFILQDLVNEVGHRLGFSVENGPYKGKKGINGFDGLWISDDGFFIVIETKTTDAYRINLDTLEGYRKQVFSGGKCDERNVSILIVVGRQDTGDLEAQIRGSIHAWKIRLISVDSLTELLRLKEEKIDDSHIIKQIFEVLRPYEYTRIDKLIKLIFLSANEQDDIEADVIDEDDVEVIGAVQTKSAISNRKSNFHERCAERISSILQKRFSRISKNLYSSVTNDFGVQICVSKTYQRGTGKSYWFALHPYYFTNLQKYDNQYIAYGCGDESLVFMIPVIFFDDLKDRLSKTESNNRFYWHIRIVEIDNTYKFELGIPKGTVKSSSQLWTPFTMSRCLFIQ